ncbi:glycoside hydrolase family 88 protein [Bacillus sp. FJAT-50079]|uniref:glycoside hydrolase family 88/105 protein n=1 Tax=Bacillus sp. FJAT-50079 TaxID=2833577 RepID=UPI0020165BC0|nr:glycoside hydrolase family 88 protein [Bacillus sp. FJAT-50079]
MTDTQMNLLVEQYMKTDKWYSSRWHYIEGCILKGYLDFYESTSDQKYYDFVKDFIDRQFNEEQNIPAINLKSYNIDQIRMASILYPLYKKEKDPKYKKILDQLYDQLKIYPRTASGNFWHKENYPNQVWLDGLYMGQPFYAQYIKEFEDEKDYSDIINQFLNVRKFAFNENNQLYYHAYDESRKMFWCDKETGRSPHVWGRGVGWFLMALVDMLEILEGEEVNSQPLKELLEEAVKGMLPYQDNSGMWYQIVDKAERPENYLETTGTLMCAYAILKAVRLGYLLEEYRTYGQAAFNGTMTKYLRVEKGEVRLGGICRSAGLGKKPETGVIRDGSFLYYTTQEKIVENNGHGVAPFLMAYNEIQILKKVSV